MLHTKTFRAAWVDPHKRGIHPPPCLLCSVYFGEAPLPQQRPANQTSLTRDRDWDDLPAPAEDRDVSLDKTDKAKRSSSKSQKTEDIR